MMLCYRVVSFAIGKLAIIEEHDHIIGIKLNGFKEQILNAVNQETPLIAEAILQLNAYFSGKLKAFDLPLKMNGTSFQKKVWEALKTIPYGETRSYGDIARQMGYPNAFRAVGMANHNNPIAIVVPCHRVIGSDGSLTGYAGGLSVKQQLLELETAFSKKRNQNMK